MLARALTLYSLLSRSDHSLKVPILRPLKLMLYSAVTLFGCSTADAGGPARVQPANKRGSDGERSKTRRLAAARAQSNHGNSLDQLTTCRLGQSADRAASRPPPPAFRLVFTTPLSNALIFKFVNCMFPAPGQGTAAQPLCPKSTRPARPSASEKAGGSKPARRSVISRPRHIRCCAECSCMARAVSAIAS